MSDANFLEKLAVAESVPNSVRGSPSKDTLLARRQNRLSFTSTNDARLPPAVTKEGEAKIQAAAKEEREKWRQSKLDADKKAEETKAEERRVAKVQRHAMLRGRRRSCHAVPLASPLSALWHGLREIPMLLPPSAVLPVLLLGLGLPLLVR